MTYKQKTKKKGIITHYVPQIFSIELDKNKRGIVRDMQTGKVETIKQHLEGLKKESSNKSKEKEYAFMTKEGGSLSVYALTSRGAKMKARNWGKWLRNTDRGKDEAILSTIELKEYKK
jgi:hypothetical protein